MEQPNLDYINAIANGDEKVKKTLINIVKSEFPEEKKAYYDSLVEKSFIKLAGNVHKLKHKISILGLEKSYEIANKFEHNLRDNSLEGEEDFDKILLVITAYLKTM